jgi:O-antigen ligase/polysaccharide polymerase Wzy-like membrane protein
MKSAASIKGALEDTPRRGFLAAIVLGGGLATALLIMWNPLVALAVAAMAMLALVVVASPDVATFTVIFILYSNIAVVASRFHGVPKVVAGVFPLLLGFPLVRDLISRRQRLIVTPALPLLLLFLAVQVLGMAFSRDAAVTRTAVLEMIFEGLLVYFLITNVVRTPRALRLAAWAVLLGGAMSAAVPCYQQLTGTQGRNYGGLGQTSDVGFRTDESSNRGEGRQLRLAGSIGEQNRYAQNMLMILPIGLYLFLGEPSRRRRTLALALTGLAGGGFLLSFSRGAAVGFLVVATSMVLLRTITARQLGGICLVAVLALAFLPQYRARMRTILETAMLASDSGVTSTEVDSSVRRRITEMLAAAAVFADHPLIGVGPGMFKYYSAEYGNRLGIRKITETRKAHSLYLEVAAENGTLGLLSFFSAVLVTLYGLIVARRRFLRSSPGESSDAKRERLLLAYLVTGLLLALISYLATGLFLHLAYIRFFYLMLGLAGAAVEMATEGGREGFLSGAGHAAQTT